jgi:acyl transferase domain-containing protein/NAD(P)-dependent dehydrogenase (short-subunit alcohol dehydrogenase family)/acyl carrier protein
VSTPDQQVVEALRASLKERERLRQENQRLHATSREPIAIVGMSCRYPGPANSPQQLWELLAAGRDAISGFPTDRGWDLQRLYDPEPDNLGTTYTREGGFVHDAADFDARFFGLGVDEARTLDPQQRLLLEAAWEAIEDAGIDALTLRGTQTGVFAGAGSSDYALRVPAELEGLRLTGTANSIVSGRVAYTLGLEGPAVTVDTACSSSLVAMHMACAALRQGECSLALAGGVTVMASPFLFIELSRQRGLAPDGRCKAFAAAADGVGFAEGAGLVVLERLSEAHRHGHRVLALVRGSAVNQDGASNGLTAPNGPSQERVIRRALANAGLSTDDVDAVEAHGTGTVLGDPIEAHALLATYGQRRGKRPLRVGSIKSNVGHTSMAAGVGGVIKMVLALRHEELPPTLHVDEPSPHVDWSIGSIKLLTQAEAWPRGEHPRRAGVSSFGISGTNAHLILEEAPVPPEPIKASSAAPQERSSTPEQAERSAPELPVLPWLVSAKSEPALRAQAERLRSYLEAHPERELLDVAFSLAKGRTQFERRAAVLGVTREQLLEGLTELSSGEPGKGVIDGSLNAGLTAFMFTGQGAQRVGMGRELCEVFPAFSESLDEVCDEFDGHLGRPLREVLFAAEGSPEAALLDATEFTQAGLFAVEVALFRLLESFGVRPDFLIGHSIGELSAAYVAGVFSLADACRLVAARGRLMGALPEGGAMLAVEASEAEVRGSLEHCAETLALAAVNGPRSMVVSGDADALEQWSAQWRERGRKTKRLRVSHAFHSPLMEPMLEELRAIARGIEHAPAQIPIVSNVTGELIGEDELADGEYWARQVRETVRFADGIGLLERSGVRRFLEVGPDGVLTAMAHECLSPAAEERALLVATLRERHPDAETLLAFLAQAHCVGVQVDWTALFAGRGAHSVDLPTYAFQRKRHWLDAQAQVGDLRSAGLRATEHPLLGASVCLAGEREQWLFTGRVSLDSQPWLGDHVILDTVVVPGTAFLELVLVAGTEIGCEMVEELTLQAPLVLEGLSAIELQLLVEEPDESGRRTFVIHSRPQAESPADADSELGEWTRHASGALAPDLSDIGQQTPSSRLVEQLAAEAWPPEGAEPVDIEGLYDRMNALGFAYGPAFAGIRAAWRRGEELFTEVALEPPHAEEAARFQIHPGLLDAALQSGGILMQEKEREGESIPRQAVVLFSWSGVRRYASGMSSLRVRVAAAGGSNWSVVALDETGAPAVSVHAMAHRPVEAQQLAGAGRQADDSLFGLEWVQAAEDSVLEEEPRVAVLGELDAPGVAERYADLHALSEAVAAGAPVPDVVLASPSRAEAPVAGAPAPGADKLIAEDPVAGAPTPAAADELIERVRSTLVGTLEFLQAWFADERLASGRLAIVSHGAVAPREGEAPGLVEAPTWGLARSAQSEYPGRLLLLDTDGSEASWRALAGALSLVEPQLALREGQVYVPRLVGVPAGMPAPHQTQQGLPEDPAQPTAGAAPLEGSEIDRSKIGQQGTILITGGTGALGAQLARRLARAHGARRLLLVSRRGGEAEGAAALLAELRELGCEVEVAACDVADRAQLAGVLASIPEEHPLRVVVHAAGVLDDSAIATLSAERLEGVLGPKVDGAVHLDELTRGLELSDFVLFSSFAGIVGSPGQGNYAAANAFLDALAQRRRAEGLVGMSLAWGPWEGGMAGGVDVADRARMQRLGVAAFSAEQGLELFDRARVVGRPLLVPVGLGTAALRAHARAGMLPALLSGLVPAASRRAAEAKSSLARQLRGLPEADWDGAILALVRKQVAAVRGLDSVVEVDPERSFSELGFDSLDAIELRNHLTRATGLSLPATLVFDYPTPVAVAKHMRTRVGEGVRRASVARRQRSEEPIAIVGMSCRYPGGVRSPRELWELVMDSRDAIGGFPEDRDWELERLYDPDPDSPGTCYAREGGFIYDVAEFDARFFGIGSHEALAMDPQQRLLLEATWEAFEDALIDPASRRGSDTGVFIGAGTSGYGARVPIELETMLLTGTLASIFSGRLAYVYGLEGPAVTVDTACSASLVALHLACTALRQGECSMALAGGVTVMASPELYTGFARQRGLAPDGRCKAFADRADGVGFSDGAGLVLVERLSDAERAGRRVLALVRGSATNQDGASNGLSAPNGPSQERVIRAALAHAGLAPGDVDAVEGHGTGTMLGDPIEAQALLATYGQERAGDPLWLGSVKSNIGHTGCGAGVAGVIKMVEALRNESLPPTLHVDAPSSHVDWSAGAVALLTESQPWPAGERPRRVGVSSFGMSGTNAHVILEEPPQVNGSPVVASAAGIPPSAESSSGVSDGGVLEAGTGTVEVARSEEDVASAGVWSCGVVPLVVSGRGGAALRGQAERLREFLGERPQAGSADAAAGLLDAAFSLVGRAVHEDRGVVLGGDRGGLVEGLGVLASGGVGEGVVRGVARGGRPVFVFPGQGAQWEGMAVELLDSSVVFRDSLSACGRALEELVDWRVEDVLRGVDGAPGLERVDVVQPVSFAVMVALAELWRSFGVQPGVVVGHSQGEIAAACVAGGLSLGDAARVVVLRSRLLGEVLAGRGGMVSVALELGRVEELLEGWGGRLSVAAVNGPSAAVVSGEAGALDEFLAMCEGDGVWARRVAVDYASHSVAVEELRERLTEALVGIEPVSCGVPFFSTATGGLLDTAQLDGEYWYRSLREQVRFEEAVRALAGEANAFIEVSPHPVLGVAVRETLEDLGVEERVGVLGSLQREEGGLGRFVHSLAEAWVCGAPVDWRAFFADSGARMVDLPKYAFQRKRYWLRPVAGGDASGMGLGAADHPLLGAAVQVAGGERWLFTGRLSLDTHGWLADHVVFESVVVPGTALLELALAAGRIAGCEVVEELTFQAPLMLSPDGAVQLQVSIGEPEENGRRELSIYSRPHTYADDSDGADGGWTQHASGTLLRDAAGAGATETAGAANANAGSANAAGAAGLGVPGLGPQWPPAGGQELDAGLLYDRLIEAGFGYGPLFQGVRAAWRRDDEIYTEVTLDADAAVDAERFGVHPALLDAALHGLCFFATEEDELESGSLPIPFSLGGVSLARQGAASLRVRLARMEGNTMSVAVWDETGEPVLAMRSLAYRMVQASQLAGARREERGSLLRNVWIEAPLAAAAEGQPRIAALGATAAPDLEGDRYEDLAALAQAIEQGQPAPDYVFVSAPAAPLDDSGLARMAHAGAQRTLELLQAWLAQPELAESQLVLLTRGAVALVDGEAPDLAAAPIWGLARSAQSENPGRVAIVDLDALEQRAIAEPGLDQATVEEAGAEQEHRVAWPALLAAEEPQLALRGGKAYVPRLQALPATPDAAPALDPSGTVLVTGGTGDLGAHVARHLAGERGAQHMLLASRSGPRAAGAQELVAELAELGCEVRVVACDVTDRGEVAALIDSIPPEHPLRVVIHAAGVLEDGLMQSLTPEQLERVMLPKVDAALHLHELTRELELSEFVLFSSAAALLGGAGQANYAAANAFLDALAQHRRAHGLPGKALAWGLWEQTRGMTGDLGTLDRARMARLGVSALTPQSGLELLDAGRGADPALVVAAHFDLGALRKQARVGVLPVLLSGLVRMPARRARGDGGSLARRLAGVPESEWDTVVLELVRSEAAAVLGREHAAEVDPEVAFKDLGFDSLGAVELRNRLMRATGLRLPATLVFDHPNCKAVAEFLRLRVEARGGAQAVRGAIARRVGSDEPIALVGMACRYPGGVRSPHELWELLAAGRDAVCGFPTDRGWDLANLYDPDPDHPRTSYAREGGFVHDIGDFDAGFFGISPREALTMDPHQRLLLETAWEAFEDAGVAPTSLRGSQTGVFAGVTSSVYALRVPEKLEGMQLTGNAPSVASGRVSYTLGLQGPAVSLDTACSSSLVALHLACRSLRDGECELALAGGATLMASPAMFVEFSRQRGLAPDGRCKPFAAAADGVGWAEGVGLVVLERLSDAQRLGHHVLALVRGSAVNQDGASNGLAAPNGPSQERVIRTALADAGLAPGEVDAVEGHGTGTMLGDPIEAQALLATYGQGRANGPLWLGSIKSNIGHAIAASGVAGVMKVALALRHELLPRTLHVDEPSPHVDWSTGDVRLLTEPQPWPAGERPRRAGVSSFGISGTNAHVILEEAPPPQAGPRTPQGAQDPPASALSVLPWLVSGRSEAALCAQAERLRAHLESHPELQPLDVAFSLATARAQHEWRAAIVAGDRDGLLAGLAALSRGEPAASVLEGRATGGRVAFMLTGQGSQRAGMGAELYEHLPRFRSALDEVCAELDGHLGRSLREVLFAAEGSPEAALLDETELTQAALFAFEVALASQLGEWGVKPELLIGHSVGEVVAAHLAGAFLLADACALVLARGRLMGALPAGGAMLAIEASPEELAQSLEHLDSRLALAAVNGPRAVVVSGDAEAVQELEGVWRERGRKVTRLRVSHAFHSQRMDPMLAELGEAVGGLTPNPQRVAVASNLTGELIADGAICTPEYWMRHARETVRFADGVAALERAGARSFVEVGPDGVLCALARGCLSADAQERALLVPAQRARDGELETLVKALAQAHTAGVSVDWPAFFAGRGARPVELPTYAFQRERYWLNSNDAGGEVGAAGLGATAHPLLGAAVQVAGGEEWLLTGRLSLASHPWIADHAVLDTVLLPGTAFLELVFAAGRRAGVEAIEELTLQAPLVLAEGAAVQLQVSLAEPDEEGRREVAVHSRTEIAGDDVGGDETQWTRHASGMLAPAAGVDPAIESLQAEKWPPAGAEPIEIEYLYDRLAEIGFGYGPAFQAVRKAWRRGEEFFVEAALSKQQAAAAESFRIHPALLDAALHPLFLEGGDHGAGLPFSWSDVRLYRDAESSLRASVVPSGVGGSPTLRITALDELGEPLVSVGSLLGRPVDASQLASVRGSGNRDSLFGLEWVELTDLPTPGEQERYALLGDLRLPGTDAERYEDIGALCAAIEAGATAPGVLFVDAPVTAGAGGEAEQLAQAARQATERTLKLLQACLAEEALADTRLVLLTRGAVAIGEQEEPDLAAAPLTGLLASVQPEHPGRFLLVDLDGGDGEAPWAQLLEADEPHLALRTGRVYVPRLVAVPAPAELAVPALDPDGTVLITGGTGGLGALVARHLASAHGVSRLLLLSRRGAEAPGAGELVRELGELGAEAVVAACDVADREAIGALLDSLPTAHPLTAVVHAAGVLEDGLFESLTPEQLERVMRPKVDAALHLHELTAGLELAAFVLFSSFTATIGSPGQGNYAAANAFLDALARHRRGRGLVGNALAWGLWADTSGMAGTIGEAGVARVGKLGIQALSNERGLELLDAALTLNQPLLAPVGLDTGVLRGLARMGALPAPLRGVVRTPARRGRETRGSLARRLAGVPEAEREGVVLELVRAHVATALGHDSPRSIDVERTFVELGFDSLSAVELRNRLYQATGLRLPATLVFDHPKPAAVAKFLLAKVEGSRSHAPVIAHRSLNANDPVVIVGMGCRYPGGVRSPGELWELVASGTDAISPFPSNRGWDLESLYDPDPDNLGTSYVRAGGFVHDVADFDARFFGMGPRETVATDPQQRLVLEVAWEAFEHARIDPLSLRGTQTGVFCGVMYQDYGYVVSASSKRDEAQGYATVGSAGSVVSGRLAYVFGLEGPAVSIDTACSSSLVALHLAAQSLRQGECSIALAGGVTVLASPAVFVDLSRQRALAPDGRSKPYAGAADGVGWSEGVGMLVLERLSDARRRGHPVLGVVRGSAVNQDGASNGLTAPNGPSQERVILQALANASVSASEVDVVEGHGTGTMLGDPIEAQALLATYGQDRVDGPLWLGSAKSNFGHTQAAAGVAGVMKMVLAMRNGLLPQTLHVDVPSPHVDWSEGAVSLLSEPVPWPRGERPRRAGVSSFGISGTNAHVILEEPPVEESSPRVPRLAEGASSVSVNGAPEAVDAVTGGAEVGGGVWSRGVVPLVVSGKGERALRAQAERLHEHLMEGSEIPLADVAFSLASTRTPFEDRGVVVGGDRDGLLSGLRALSRGEPATGVVMWPGGGSSREVGGGGPVFVFPGQGSQWEGMAVELLDSSGVFRDSLRACGQALEEVVEWRVEDVLRGVSGAPALERIDVVQPVLFAVIVSLAALWRACGVEPGVVVGHSQGEIAAAHVAGGLSLEDAARLVALRSRLLVDLVGRGGIVSVALSEGELRKRLEAWGDRVVVSAVNGPSSVAVAGDPESLRGLLAELEGDGVRARLVPATVATHSRQAEPLREELLAALDGITPRSGNIPFLSTVTGGFLDTAELDAEYWYRNMREPVQFERATRLLLEDGWRAFVEVSPHPVLTFGVRETVEHVFEDPDGSVVVGSLRRDEGGLERFLHSLAEVWVYGVGVDWRGLFTGSGARQVDLPTYAFQRERHWAEGELGMGDMTAAGLLATGHPLLGAAVRVAGRDEWLFTSRLSLATHPWIGDHAVLGTVLLPGTAFVELALAAGKQVGCEVLEELTLETPLVLGDDAVQLQMLIGAPDELQQRQITICSCSQSYAIEGLGGEAPWVRHASGALAQAPADADPALAGAVGQSWPPLDAEPIDVELLYDQFAEVGLDYGPVFQGAKAAWRRGEEIFVEVALDEQHADAAKSFGIHPALFDAALHTGFGLGKWARESSGLPLPFSFSGVRLYGEGHAALRVLAAPGAAGELRLTALDTSGEPVLSVDSLVTRPIDASQLAGARAAGQNFMFALDWIELQVPASNSQPQRLVLLGEPWVGAPDVPRYADLRELGEALAQGEPVPDAVLAQVAPAAVADEIPRAARGATAGVLELLQAWLAEEQLAEAQLVLVTRGAVAVEDGEVVDLVVAPMWGLVRSAQSENPDRLILVDLDPDIERGATDPSWAELCVAEEPQLAVRGGQVLTPRLVRTPALADESVVPFDSEGTVLITGGMGGLGVLLARHLAETHGVRRLVLTSRRGPEAEGAGELVDELQELGCEARVVACDVSDRAQCAALIEGIGEEYPLRGVIHAAGVLEDGIVASMSVEQVERVMRPKVDGAFHLHELTAGMELSEFVMFSSAAGVMGSPGQANYAAGNAFLDALAQHRRARGLTGRSLAWGLWAQQSGMTDALDQGWVARLERIGVLPLANEQGLRLFDEARLLDRALLIPIHVDAAGLRAQVRVGMLPALMRGLVRVPARRQDEGSLARRLAGVPEAEWEAAVLELVRGEVAAVLGHSSASEIDPQAVFTDLGFDSLGAVELRNRLKAVTGLRLPATLVFDYPTPAQVAAHILERAARSGVKPEALVDGDIDRLQARLATIGSEEAERRRVAARLQTLLEELRAPTPADAVDVAEQIQSASAEEMFDFIDRELEAY